MVVAPVRRISKEWRFVVVGKDVIAGSGYVADGREATDEDPKGPAWRLAADVAESLTAPEPVYVLDVCLGESGFRLLEFNPFSGADLYGCDGAQVVRYVSKAAFC